MRRHLLGVAAAFAAATLFACGGGSDDAPTAVPTLAPLPTRVPTTAGTAPASPSPAASPSASASPSVSPSPVPDAGTEREAAVAAALAAVDGIYVSPLTFDACLEDNPDERICIELRSDDASLVGGVAQFMAGDPLAGSFTFFMGRMPGGAWGYWFGTVQETAVLGKLPAEIRVCGPGGGPVDVRDGPDAGAAVVGSLDTLSTALAEEFVLLASAAFGQGTAPGAGAYRISGAIDGWISAEDTSDAALGDCSVHDATTGDVPHG